MKVIVTVLVALAAATLPGHPAGAAPPDDDQVESSFRDQLAADGATGEPQYVTCSVDASRAVCFAVLTELLDADPGASPPASGTPTKTGSPTSPAEPTPAVVVGVAEVPTTDTEAITWTTHELYRGPSGATATPDSVPVATGDVGTRDHPVPLGTAAEVGYGWTMVVNSVTLDADADLAADDLWNEPPPPGSQYVMANVSLTYDGAEASDSAGVNLQALGASNVTLSQGGSTYATPPGALDLFTEVFQGGTITGNIVFEVPTTDVESLVIIGHAFMSFDDSERAFFATS